MIWRIIYLWGEIRITIMRSTTINRRPITTPMKSYRNKISTQPRNRRVIKI
jgi:hypothetical protein